MSENAKQKQWHKYLRELKNDALKQADGESLLDVLYENYDAFWGDDDDTIRSFFGEIYDVLSDKPLQETDEIINSVCALATYYERRGFTEGVKTGIRLGIEEGLIE